MVNLRPEDAQVIKDHDGLKPVLYLRKHTTVDPENIVQATLYATARGVYNIFFNSEVSAFTNQGQPRLSPGWTDYNKTIQYQVYDVTRRIRNANVTIGAMLGTGWYSGYVGPSRKHSYYGNDEFLLVQVNIDYKNGSRVVITSDNSWKVTTGAEVYSDILHGELFYEDRQLFLCFEHDYNDTLWSPVITKPINNSIKLVAEASQELDPNDIFMAVDSWSLSPNVTVYDFGINLVGYALLYLVDFADLTTIQVRHAEMLNPDGTIYTNNLRYARAIDTYVLNGK